jgi:hypothetical protein
MTAKEFLKSIGKRELENINGQTGEYVVTHEAIEKYARQEAILFAEWLRMSDYEGGIRTWFRWESDGDEYSKKIEETAEQLYEQFKQGGEK